MREVDAALDALDRALSVTTREARRQALAGVLAWTAARLVDTASNSAGDAPTRADADDLLNVQEAAARLKVAPDWVYRRSKTLPFTVRLGPRVLRFSAAGIDRWIIQRRTRDK